MGRRTSGQRSETATITPGDIARYCDLDIKVVYRWIEGDLLKAEKLPSGHRRITVRDFEDFLSKNRVVVSDEFYRRFHRRALIVTEKAGDAEITKIRLRGLDETIELDVASDMIDALLKVGEKKPNLLVVDINTPEMLQACIFLAEHPPSPTFALLLLTPPRTTPEIETLLSRNGLSDVLTRPCTRAVFVEAAAKKLGIKTSGSMKRAS